MKIGYIIMMVLCLCFRCEAQTWTLVWSDEFNDPSINTTNWTFDIGGNGWGNSELEYYTSRPENAKLENGNLLIIARKESYSGNNYTSSRLKTQNLQNFTYGKIEARIKIPVGQGLWVAFWILGQDISQVGWPKCGEVDIMEHINKENMNHGTMHWDNNGHVSYGGSVSCNESIYHTYSIEWDADSIKWLLDGNEYWVGNITNNINSTEEFHLPFFIILNVAVGGNWPGSPDASTLFPDTMFVDYVRVYQLAANTVKDANNLIPSDYSLSQNYPNPFNPSTTITFSLPVTSMVSLRIFNDLGKEVSDLVSEELTAGTYSRQWKAADLPSGVYFYRLSAEPTTQRDLVPITGRVGQTGMFSETKKLVLLK